MIPLLLWESKPEKEPTAVAIYLLRVKSRTAKGEITEEDNQESDVLFKRDGSWKVVFLHYSPAAKKKQ